MTEPLGGLLAAPPAIVAAGVDVFSDALRAQGAEVHDMDWRPPGFGSAGDLAALALDPRRAIGEPHGRRAAARRRLGAGRRPARARGDRAAPTACCCTPGRR